MEKNKRKQVQDMLFEVYDKGVQNEECNLGFYYEKIMQVLGLAHVVKSDCDHEWLNHSFDHFGFLQEQICAKCGAKQSVP